MKEACNLLYETIEEMKTVRHNHRDWAYVAREVDKMIETVERVTLDLEGLWDEVVNS